MSSSFIARSAVALAFALGFADVCFSQTNEVAKDARLQNPVSIKLKVCQLPDALKQIGKLAGVKLANVAPISDLKVTVLVKDVPAGLVMDKIANVLGCHWTADGDLFRLSMDNEERIRRDRFMEAENDASQKRVDAELNLLAKISAAETNVAVTQSPDQEKQDPDQLAIFKKVNSRRDSQLGRFLANMNERQTASFWRGDVVIGPIGGSAPTQAADNQSATADSIQGTFRAQPRRRPGQIPLFVQYDPALYQVRVAQMGNARSFSVDDVHLVTDFLPVGKLAETPFGKEVLGWNQDVPIDGDLAKIIMERDQTSLKATSPKLTVADLLESAFDATGTPIVADGFRVSARVANPPPVSGPLTTWLTTIKQATHIYTHFEDGVILVRHAGFWRLRRFEIPEEVLVPLESKVAASTPTIDDYALLASKLTSDQAKALMIKGEVITKFSLRPIQLGLPALQFYALLNNRAIVQASGNGIAFETLGSGERQLFTDAALECPFFGRTSPGFYDSLTRLASTGDARGLGFLKRPVELGLNGVVSSGDALIFGLTGDQSSTYNITYGQ